VDGVKTEVTEKS